MTLSECGRERPNEKYEIDKADRKGHNLRSQVFKIVTCAL